MTKIMYFINRPTTFLFCIFLLYVLQGCTTTTALLMQPANTKHHHKRLSSSLPRQTNSFYKCTTKYSTATTSALYEKKNDEGETPKSTTTTILDRFTNPRIDDPWLPINEAGLVQIVAPTLQLFWLLSMGSSFPSWATPLFDYTFAPRGAFLAPTLIHGAALACCWLLGCLAAKGYERESYQGTFGEVTVSTIKAGAFACGILIMATQIDLYFDMGGYYQIGDTAETDIRIFRALVEVINDIVFEFITILPWRLLRSTIP